MNPHVKVAVLKAARQQPTIETVKRKLAALRFLGLVQSTAIEERHVALHVWPCLAHVEDEVGAVTHEMLHHARRRGVEEPVGAEAEHTARPLGAQRAQSIDCSHVRQDFGEAHLRERLHLFHVEVIDARVRAHVTHGAEQSQACLGRDDDHAAPTAKERLELLLRMV